VHTPHWYVPGKTSKTSGSTQLAAVVACCRYPAPNWWQDMSAFIPETADTVEEGIAARYPPDSYVYIRGQRYQLAAIPKDGSHITVDVTQPAANSSQPVAVGDRVCILCENHTLADLGRVSRGRAEGCACFQVSCAHTQTGGSAPDHM
jgi:hypothetical protein